MAKTRGELLAEQFEDIAIRIEHVALIDCTATMEFDVGLADDSGELLISARSDWEYTRDDGVVDLYGTKPVPLVKVIAELSEYMQPMFNVRVSLDDLEEWLDVRNKIRALLDVYDAAAKK